MQNPQTFPENDGEFLLQGPVGQLQVKTAAPKERATILVTMVICHPHPLYGGTMENKVVTTIFRTFRDLGVHVVRFNYRGVGKSEGAYGETIGEIKDLLAVMDWAKKVRPMDQIWLAGFSFGCYITAKATELREVKQLISIAPAVNHFEFTKIKIPDCPWLVIQGDKDEVVDPLLVFDWAKSLTKNIKLIKMSGVTHFFHGRLLDLRKILEDQFGRSQINDFCHNLADFKRPFGKLSKKFNFSMTVSPLIKYQQLIQSGKFQTDAEQNIVVEELDRIYQQLQAANNKKFFQIKFHQPTIKGLYIYGEVGIGKTWMMDLFCDTLPESIFMRMHFHQFMQFIHQQLTKLQGEKNPLSKLIKSFGKKIRVVCLDEFFVKDIADAMLLAGLLKALFLQGICLVTTSNIAPNFLYKGGINRERFLPAINLIKEHTKILHLPTKKDYRLEKLANAEMFYAPINEKNMHKFQNHFKLATDNRYIEDEILTIENRPIATVAAGHGIVWFDFNELCTVPRSQIDYIEIAKIFDRVFLSNVPQFSKNLSNEILYFINLVDVFYDMNIELVILAEVNIDELCLNSHYQFEFQRTRSRLHEMQNIFSNSTG